MDGEDQDLTGPQSAPGRASDEVARTPELDVVKPAETGQQAGQQVGGEVGGGVDGGRRRRRANVRGGRHHAHRVKVTPEEEARLLVLANAQGVSVPRLLVESALSVDRGITATERRELVAEVFTVKRLLANVANNVNQLARVANSTSEVRPEAVHYTREARRLVERLTGMVEDFPR